MPDTYNIYVCRQNKVLAIAQVHLKTLVGKFISQCERQESFIALLVRSEQLSITPKIRELLKIA